MSYNVTIEEVLNNVTVTPPNSNQIAVSTTAFPVTISYNSTVYDKGEKGDKGDTGDQGPQGIQGATGAKGDTGEGVVAGGAPGQILAKIDSTDYNTEWVTPFTAVSQDTAPSLGADLDVNGKKIVSAAGDITIQPTAAGNLNLHSNKIVVGENIGLTGYNEIVSFDNSRLMIRSQNTAGEGSGFYFTPGATSSAVLFGATSVEISSDTLRVGPNSGPAVITSQSNANLILTANSNNNAGTINISSNANGNIVINPAGSGTITAGASIIPDTNIAYDLGSPTNKWRTLYLSGSTIFLDDTPISVVDGSLTVDGNTVTRVQDDTAPVLGGNLSVGNRTITSTDRVRLSAPTAIDVQSPLILLGSGNTKTQIANSNSSIPGITINSNSGNSNATAAEIRIGTSSEGDINLVPKVGGRVIASGNKLPNSTGSSGQVLRTDGAGSAYWDDEQDITIVSESQPQVAATGDQWFNPTTQILKVYTAAGWVQVTADDLQY
jgi:hypothetical protein